VAIAGEMGNGDGWEVGQKGEDDEGDQFPYPPRVVVALRDESTMAGDCRQRWLGTTVLEVQERERKGGGLGAE
jgi:hypothetical protein